MHRLLASLLLIVTAAVAGDGSPYYDKVKVDDLSPRRTMMVEHYFERGGTDQIWLVSMADPAKRKKLFTHERHAEVIFSPDEDWLVINNHCLSNESRLLLFKKQGELEYAQVADLTDAAWTFFAKSNGLKGEVPFDHSYVSALQWIGAGDPVLLLSLNGHLDSRNHTSDWLCLYEVKTQHFSTDIAAINRRSTALEGAK